ncbi:MAG TPA: YgeY family selenium metabolism-linked hydrolase [Clostridia bacterium]|nr:YgeY family selenium metabolism-linked hydrolase [Clostridia bacterium]
MATQELVELARQLIRIKSVTGAEQELAGFVRDYMLESGYDEAVIDEAGNVIGVIRGRGGTKLLFDAHLDTVGAGDASAWTYDPFGGEVADGKLYGRGAADMKGALAAMLYAGAQLAHCPERPFGDIYISGTVSEEVAEGQCFELVLDRVRPDLVIIGEASELNLKIGQRGRAEILVRTTGKSAHSSNPALAVNAAEHLADAIRALRRAKLGHDPLLGDAIMVLTDMISHPYPGQSVIPYAALATYDRRLLVGETEEGILAGLQELVTGLREENPNLQVSFEIAAGEHRTYTGYQFLNKRFFPAWQLPPEHPYVRQSLTALRAAGLSPQVSAYRFCTNGSASMGKRGIPTIGFGPGHEHQAHIVDEFIDLTELEQAMLGYRALMGCHFVSLT